MTAILISTLTLALIAGWSLGKFASSAAEHALHLPTTAFGKLLPLVAALALAGGVSVGAWQAKERLIVPVEERESSAECSTTTLCSPCSECPRSQ